MAQKSLKNAWSSIVPILAKWTVEICRNDCLNRLRHFMSFYVILPDCQHIANTLPTHCQHIATLPVSIVGAIPHISTCHKVTSRRLHLRRCGSKCRRAPVATVSTAPSVLAGSEEWLSQIFSAWWICNIWIYIYIWYIYIYGYTWHRCTESKRLLMVKRWNTMISMLNGAPSSPMWSSHQYIPSSALLIMCEYTSINLTLPMAEPFGNLLTCQKRSALWDPTKLDSFEQCLIHWSQTSNSNFTSDLKAIHPETGWDWKVWVWIWQILTNIKWKGHKLGTLTFKTHQIIIVFLTLSHDNLFPIQVDSVVHNPFLVAKFPVSMGLSEYGVSQHIWWWIINFHLEIAILEVSRIPHFQTIPNSGRSSSPQVYFFPAKVWWLIPTCDVATAEKKKKTTLQTSDIVILLYDTHSHNPVYPRFLSCSYDVLKLQPQKIMLPATLQVGSGSKRLRVSLAYRPRG